MKKSNRKFENEKQKIILSCDKKEIEFYQNILNRTNDITNNNNKVTIKTEVIINGN